MIPRGLCLLAASILTAGSSAVAQPSQPPFSYQDVDFTPGCRPNAAFDRLLGVLLPRSAGGEDAEPEFDEPLYNAVSGYSYHVLHLSNAAEWNGLRLVEVRLHHGIESGPSNASLVFADNPGRVREVWNARGWNLPPAGETRVIEDEIITTAVGIEMDGELAAVTCFVD
jgi:hypothetical protein